MVHHTCSVGGKDSVKIPQQLNTGDTNVLDTGPKRSVPLYILVLHNITVGVLVSAHHILSLLFVFLHMCGFLLFE
jgi:hypothetical protein